jgi:hypothetical protein
MIGLVAAALAGPVFDSVSAETNIGLGGNWARFHAGEDGWWFFQMAGGDYWVEDVEPDFSGYDDRQRIQLSQHGHLQDAQVERCPDGGWLVVGSATVTAPNDSAYAFRSDADFVSEGSVTVEEGVTDVFHNDMVPFCTRVATGASFTTGDFGHSGSRFFDLDGVRVGDSHDFPVPGTGSSLAIRPSDERIVAGSFDGAGSRDLRFTVMDPDWSVVEEYSVELPEDYALWTQRLMPLGDGWLLAHVLRPSEFGEPEGEIWVQALDAEFNIVDSIRVSPEGTSTNNRPWIARRDDVIAVSYDRDVQPRMAVLTLKADAVPAGDDGIQDTAAPAGSGGSDSADEPSAEVPCGCGTGAGAGGAGVLAALGVLRRRGNGRGDRARR